MEKRKKKIQLSCLVALFAACLIVSPCMGATVEIKEMQFTFIGLPYYSQKTLGFSESAVGDASVAIPTSPTTAMYAYSISNAVVTLSDAPLSGPVGTNTGTFNAPITLTVTGVFNNTQTQTALTGDVVLLEATMTSNSLVMTEVLSDFAAGSAFFDTVGGALFAGVADGDDTIILQDFEMGLWGSDVPVLFGESNSMTPYNAGLQISADAVPEPTTILLLSTGLLVLSKKRKHS